jgi:cytochrome P450
VTTLRSRVPLLDAVALARDPEGFLARCGAERGDPFTLRLPGLGAVVVTGDAEGAREIFSAPPETFEPLANNPVEPLLGRHSLILLGGERHKRERKLMMPSFHGERMRAYAEVFRDATLRAIANARSGETIVLQDLTRTITLEIVIRAVFGVQRDERARTYRAAIGRLIDAYVAPLVVLPALRRRFGGVGPWARFEKARAEVVALLHEEIAERRAQGTAGREDVLSMLVDARYDGGEGLTDDELVDELSTLLVAGHETTATVLVWALVYVHANARVLAALVDEVRSPGADAPERLAELAYLGATCSEALRVHPVVPVVVRRIARPFRLRGVDVAPGGAVALATTLLHANESAFPDAARFRPERFLERKFGPFEYAPFGGGARRCLGAAFASYELKIVLGTLLASTRFEPLARVPEGRPVLRNITMGPPPMRLVLA